MVQRRVRRRWWARVGRARRDGGETGLVVEKRKRGSARPTACRPAAKRRMALVFAARTGKVAAARLRALVNAKTLNVVRHDGYLADA